MLFFLITTCVEMNALRVPWVWTFRLLNSSCIFRSSEMWFEVIIFIKPNKSFISFYVSFWASWLSLSVACETTSVQGPPLPSTVDNFRQHLLHYGTSFIAFSMNELKVTVTCSWIGKGERERGCFEYFFTLRCYGVIRISICWIIRL